jgi:small conductance mechanosensitive channel
MRTCSLVYDLTGNSRFAEWSDVVVGKPLAVIGLVLFGVLVRWLLHRAVDKVAKRAERPVLTNTFDPAAIARRHQRAGALSGVLKSIVTMVVVIVVTTLILSEFGVNVAPIIASAGIIGIALGFGAQSLVRDILSGIFIFAEDQYGVGDIVDLGEAIGTVEAVTLRTTRLRGIDGTVWYVPNGEILRVGNKSQNWSRAVVDVDVAYAEDLDRVQVVLLEVARSLIGDDEYGALLAEEPEVTGVENLAADGITLRVMTKTMPLQNWVVQRELRKRIKARFDAEGIEIPFAQRVVWHRHEGEQSVTGEDGR